MYPNFLTRRPFTIHCRVPSTPEWRPFWKFISLERNKSNRNVMSAVFSENCPVDCIIWIQDSPPKRTPHAMSLFLCLGQAPLIPLSKSSTSAKGFPEMVRFIRSSAPKKNLKWMNKKHKKPFQFDWVENHLNGWSCHHYFLTVLPTSGGPLGTNHLFQV